MGHGTFDASGPPQLTFEGVKNRQVDLDPKAFCENFRPSMPLIFILVACWSGTYYINIAGSNNFVDALLDAEATIVIAMQGPIEVVTFADNFLANARTLRPTLQNIATRMAKARSAQVSKGAFIDAAIPVMYVRGCIAPTPKEMVGSEESHTQPSPSIISKPTKHNWLATVIKVVNIAILLLIVSPLAAFISIITHDPAVSVTSHPIPTTSPVLSTYQPSVQFGDKPPVVITSTKPLEFDVKPGSSILIAILLRDQSGDEIPSGQVQYEWSFQQSRPDLSATVGNLNNRLVYNVAKGKEDELIAVTLKPFENVDINPCCQVKILAHIH